MIMWGPQLLGPSNWHLGFKVWGLGLVARGLGFRV